MPVLLLPRREFWVRALPLSARDPVSRGGKSFMERGREWAALSRGGSGACSLSGKRGGGLAKPQREKGQTY